MRSSLVLVTLLGVFTAAPVPAQCNGPTQAQITSYGSTCDFFGQPATLQGHYDATSCTLTLQLSTARTCCNTFPQTQLLLLGTQPIVPGLPHPLLVSGCLLSVQPLSFLMQPASAGGTWSFVLPPLPPLTFFVQGLDDYFTTIGLSHDLQSSNALRIDLS